MNLSDWITGWARARPRHVALHFEGDDITYRELDRRVRRLALQLGAAGIVPGDRIAHLGYNSPDILYLVFACARLGAILVPLNWRLAPAEHAYILNHSGAKVVVAEAGFDDHCGLLRAQFPTIRWLPCPIADHSAEGDVVDSRAATDHFEQSLLLVYTSGTTGRPKGAVLTQRAVFWNAVNSAHAHDLTSADHVLTDLPMFHVGGLNIQTLPALHAGATVTLCRRFDPAQSLAAISGRRPTVYLMVPPTMQALIRHPSWDTADLGSIRVAMAGSSTIPVSLLQAFIDRGVPTGQIYGATETCPIAVYLRAEDAASRIGSCGKPAIHCEVRILDDGNNDAAPGERGEIVVRGPSVMSRYWHDPAATDAAFINGYFRTGDIAHSDDAGYFYIDDRKHDVIISGGENIYPGELENILAECPDLSEYAVVGRPHTRWGEVPVAVVVPAAGRTVDTDALLARFRGRLARYKHPHDVVIASSLPRSSMGKIQRFELRRQMTQAGAGGGPSHESSNILSQIKADTAKGPGE